MTTIGPVGIPMLPVVKGPLVTTRAIRRYGWATILLSFLGIWALPEGGALYGLLILPFNGRLLQMVERLAAEPNNRVRAKGIVSLVDPLSVRNLSLACHEPNGWFRSV
jgi:protoheme IX farnesyltransferase